MQYSYSALYNANSTREIGTLQFFKERYNRKNVTPDKVSRCYEGTEQLFISAGKAYIVAAAMEFWGIKDLASKPTKNLPPPNIIHKPKTEKERFYNEVVGRFVDQYVLHDPDAELLANYDSLCGHANNVMMDHTYSCERSPLGSVPDFRDIELEAEDDFIRNYGMQFIHLTVMLLQLKDTASEGDGNRAAINEKLLLTFFKSNNNYSKYALEMLISIIQKEALLSERMAEKVKWGKFVNWRGGEGNNVENNLAQEICVNIAKTLIKSMGANKTENAISLRTKAVTGIRDILLNFDNQSDVPVSSSKHTRRSCKEDEKSMIKDLQSIRPFNVVPGRRHPSFPNVQANPRSNLDMADFHKWIKKHLKQLDS